MATSGERLGILGGTFDPIHHGHLILASELRAALKLDRVLLVPNARSPFRPVGAASIAEHRRAMLALVVAETPWLDLSTIELDRGGVSYTVDTLRSLQRAQPDAHLVFMMGADSLTEFHQWREPDQILRLAEIGVALRPSTAIDVDAVIEHLPSAAGRITLVPTPLIDISSSDIRARTRARRPIRFMVPQSVEAYIRTNELYAG